ncbi:MAG TPA: UvrB/UvrC motif-containing protein [Terriglobia bacterium]|nr:UvrB/UvrC motif-containing protein [Terriglobia bacterium]
MSATPLEHSIRFDPGGDDSAFFGSLTDRSAVFAIFPENSGAPYLGRTQNLRRRLQRLLSPPQEVSRRLNLRIFAREIRYQPTGSSFEEQWLLYGLNREFYPRQFRKRLRLKLPVLVKVKLQNRFPRCYPTRRLSKDGSLYCGPFASRREADRYTAEFLDLFKIRRCVPDLDPNPSHPGCIYSQMQMCLAPCFKGCTDEDYQQEVARVVDFLQSDGRTLSSSLQEEREQASRSLEFEQAARLHRKLEKIQEVVRAKGDLARPLLQLNAVIVLAGDQERSVTFFKVEKGRLSGPFELSLDERVSAPAPLDEQLRLLLGIWTKTEDRAEVSSRDQDLPPWEHLSMLARWYYSSFREGELVMLPANGQIPHARIIRLCRKMIGIASQQPE